MKSQNTRLLSYLRKYKNITPLQAIDKLGIMRLSERIRELIADGHKIDRLRKVVKNRFNQDVRVGYYVLKNK